MTARDRNNASSSSRTARAISFNEEISSISLPSQSCKVIEVDKDTPLEQEQQHQPPPLDLNEQ